MPAPRPPALLLLLAALRATLGPCACTAQPVEVFTLQDLQAAVANGGTYSIVNASITLNGALTLNGTNTSLTLLGNTTACGGLCALDANHTGGHFVVSMGYTLTVDSLAFINSLRGETSGDPCLGGVTRGGPGLGDALTVTRNCAPGNLRGPDYGGLGHLNDLPCGFLRCSSVIVAANASLFVNNSLFRDNKGNAGLFGAMGAAISIVATADFSIENTQFVNNVVQDAAGGSWGNSGGAISIDQPFSALVYPFAFKDAPDSRLPDTSDLDWNPITATPNLIELMQIRNCSFSQNEAARGGAIFLALNTGTLNITGSTFDANVALGTYNWLSALGGAIYAHEYTSSRPFKGLVNDYANIQFPWHAHYVITDCAFLNNAARPKQIFLTKGIQTVAAKGGAVAAQAGGYGISFVRCTFVANEATNGGAIFYSGNSRTNDVFLYTAGIFNIEQVHTYDGSSFASEDYAQIGLSETTADADYLSLAPYAEESTYMLRIDGSSFIHNTASSGVAPASGGALHIDCGTAAISGSTFTTNSVASAGTSFDALNSGGALFATNNCLTADAAHLLTTSVAVLNSTFEANQAFASGAAVAAVNHLYPGSGLQSGTVQLDFVGSAFTDNHGAQLGGALYLDATSLATVSSCNFTSNAATEGGAIYALGGAAQHTFNVSMFTSNAAAVGGAIAGAGTAVLATNACSFVANEAVNGSAIAILMGGALVSSDDVFSSNTASAFGGAVFSTGDATLSSPMMSSNTAPVGAAVFSADALTLSAVAFHNVAKNYGPVSATLPASYALFYSAGVALPLVGATLSFQSGAALNLSLQMFDAYSQSVTFWSDLVADVTCLSCGGSSAVVGNTNAVYFSYSAAFPSLAVSGSVGSTAVLGLKVASPSIPLFGGAGVMINISVTIAPCGLLEVFQNLRCVCAPGTFLNGTSQQCQTCSPGSFSPAAGAVACTVNPPGFASSTQTTFASSVTLSGVSASNFGAGQNTTLTAALASTLAAPASAVVIVAVNSASPSGRHLLQASAAVAFSVATTNATQASSLRSALNATAALAGSLTAALRGSADPVLSAVTGVVAALPAETNLVLAALPCPAGTYLNGLTQSCDECAVGLVTTSTGSTTCTKCPPRFAWLNSSQCSPCPDSSVTSPGNPAQCACSSGYYDTLYGANATAPNCALCPIGGACDTGYVAAAAGWWREDTRSVLFYRCRVDVCVAENITGPLSAQQVPLPPAGRPPENCVMGNTGPLCAVCKVGFALQSGECAPCDPEDAWDSWSQDSKGGLLIGCIIAGLLVLAIAFLQPVWPALERAVDVALQAAADGARRAADACSACFRRCCCRGPPVDEHDAAADTKAAQPPRDASDKSEHNVAATGDKAGAETAVSAASGAAAPMGHHHRTRRIDVNAVEHSLASNAAFAVGNVAAFVAEVDGGAQEEDTGAGGEASGVERQTDFLDRVEEVLLQFKAAMKIFINFFQIASTFLKSLDVPWPGVFGAAMSRISLINLNLVELPAAACLHPSPSYYSTFNGYTLGLLAALGLSAVTWQLGKRVVAPLALRGVTEAERAERLARLNRTALSRTLLLLYLVYPGVSVAIFAVFTCTTFESGDSYLDADARIMCYDSVHKRYMGGAAVWLVLVPFGVPAFFLWLLRRFKVPQLAKLLNDNALLQEAIKLAWAEGLAQPTDAATLTVDSVLTLHLEALFAFFLHDVSAEDATEILAGTRPPVAFAAAAADAEDPEEPTAKSLSAHISLGAYKMAHHLSGTLGRLAGVQSGVSKRIVLIRSVAAKVAGQDEAVARRALVLTSLLTQLRNTDDIAVPPLLWEPPTEDEAAALALCSPDALGVHASGLRCADVPQLMKTAMSEVSFLFAAYRMDCWYWEVVELIRKLALTSILALIAPGSAGQVVVGILISFTTLVATLVMSPYAQKRLNLIGQVAQMHLFFLLFVALLLKLNVDGEQDSNFFGGIVIAVCTVPVILPLALRLYLRFVGGGLEARALVRDAEW